MSHDALAKRIEVQQRRSGGLVVDPYLRSRATGAFIVIDETSNDTVAAGMVV